MKLKREKLWKILEWGSWYVVGVLVFLGCSVLTTINENMWWWLYGFTIVGLIALYGEAMKRKGKVDEE